MLSTDQRGESRLPTPIRSREDFVPSRSVLFETVSTHADAEPKQRLIQEQVQRIIESTDRALEQWHLERTDGLGRASKITDPTLPLFINMARNLATLMSIYSQSGLSSSCQIELLRTIARFVKTFRDEEQDFAQDMLPILIGDLHQAANAFSLALQAQEHLLASLKEPPSMPQLLAAYQRLHEARAVYLYHQHLCEASDRSSLASAITGIEQILLPLKQTAPAAGWLRESFNALMHPFQTAFPTMEQGIAEDEERLNSAITALTQAFHDNLQSLRIAAQPLETTAWENANRAFVARIIEIDPQGVILGAILNHPFDARSPFAQHKQLALIMSLEAALPSHAHQLKTCIQAAKTTLLQVLNITPPADPTAFSIDVIQREDQWQTLRQVAAWQAREKIAYQQEINSAADSKIRKLGLFLFLPLQLGAIAYDWQQRFQQGAWLQEQKEQAKIRGHISRWASELRECGYAEELPLEWRENPALIHSWLTALFHQLTQMSDAEFEIGSQHLPLGPRQMLARWRAETNPTATPRERPIVPLQLSAFPSDELIQTSAAATNELFLASMVKKIWGWLRPSISADTIHREIEQYQEWTQELKNQVEKGKRPEYQPLLDRAEQTSSQLTTLAATLSGANEAERNQTLIDIRTALHVSIGQLQPICQALQEQKALRFTLLIEPEPFPVDDRLLQHVLLSRSAAGKGTGLEGYDPPRMLEHHLTIMSRKAHTITRHPLCTSLQKEFCEAMIGQPCDLTPKQETALFQTIQQKMETALIMGRAFQGSDEEFRSAMQTTVSALNVGDSFFFQGGWTKIGSASGHSIVYEVIRQQNGKYTFRIYNRGEGINNYYACARIQSKNQCLPFTEILDVRKVDLLNPLFLLALQEIWHPPVDGEDWDPDELYQTALSYLQGRESHFHYSANQALELLQVGHCTFLSLGAYLSQQLGSPERYERWLEEIEFITLYDYSRGAERDKIDPILFKKTIRQFAHDIEIHFQKGLISVDELQFLQAKVAQLEQLHEEIVAERFAIQEQKATRRPLITRHQKSETFEIEAPVMDENPPKPIENAPYDLLSVRDWTFSPSTFSHDLDLFLSKIQKAKQLRPPLGIKEAIREAIEIPLDWVREPGTPSLDFFFPKIQKAERLEQSLVIKEAIREFILKIPLDWTRKPINEWDTDPNAFCSQMSVIDGEATMQNLATLSQEWMDSILKTETPDYATMGEYDKRVAFTKIHPREILIQAKILTLADMLLRRAVGIPIPNLIEKSLWNFLDGSHPYHDIKDDPRSAIDRENLELYWQQISPHKYQVSFFQLDHPMIKNGDVSDPIKTIDQLPKNSDLQFAYQWLMQHPQDKQVIHNLLTPYVKHSDLYLAHAALCDRIELKEDEYDRKPKTITGVRLFPRGFYLLRDMALQTHQLLESGIYFPSFQRTLTFANGRFNYRSICPEYSTHLFRIFEWSDYRVNRIDKRQFKIEHYIKKMPSIESFVEDRDGDYLVLRRRIVPHERLLVPGDSKQLLPISSIPDLQIRETLSYFEQNRALLQNPEYQTLFEMLLLEQIHLLNEFSNHPVEVDHLAAHIAHFFKGQIHFYEQIHDITTTNFILRMNNLVERIWRFAQTKNGFTAVSPFENSQDHWKSLLKQTSSVDEQSILWGQLAISYADEKELTNTAASDLLAAQIFFEWNGLSREHPMWSAEQEEERRDLLVKKRLEIEEALADPARRDQILNEVTDKLTGEHSQEEWSGQFPRYTSKSQTTTIDVLRGKFFRQGASLQNLPLKMRNAQYYTRFFGTSFSPAVEIQPHLWEMIHQQRRYRLREYGDRIFRYDGQEWQRYYSPDDFVADHFKSLTSRSDTWVSSREVIFENAKTKKVWARADATLVDKPLKTGEVHAADAIDAEKILKIGEIQEIVDGKPTGLCLRPIDREDYSFIQNFEELGWILVWHDQGSHEPRRLEYPRYGLSFQARKSPDGTWEYDSDQYPHYRLARVQAHKDLAGIRALLILENEKTQEKRILLPAQSTGGFNILSHPNDHLRFIELEEDITTGSLKITSIEGTLKLAEFMLWTGDYYQAMHFLNGCEPKDQYTYRSGESLRPFNEHELNIIYNILAIDDMAPDAIAVRMKAQLILIKNRQESQLPKNILKRKGNDVASAGEIQTRRDEYETFLQHRDQGQDPFLSEQDEKLFIQYALDRTKLQRDEEQKLTLDLEPFGTIESSFHDFYYGDTRPFDDAGGLSDCELIPLKKPSVLRPTLAPEMAKHFLNLIRQSAFKMLYFEWTGLSPESHWTNLELKKIIEQLLQSFLLVKYDPRKSYSGHSDPKAGAYIGAYLLSALRKPEAYHEELQADALALAKSFSLSVVQPTSQNPETIRAPSIPLLLPSSETLGQEKLSSYWHRSPNALLPSQERLIDAPENYFTIAPPDLQKKEQTKQAIDEWLSPATRDRTTNEHIVQLREEFHQYFASPEALRSCYQVSDRNLQDLTALRADLVRRNREQQIQLRSLELFILTLANQSPADPTAAAYREVTAASGTYHYLTLQELMHFASSHDMAPFRSRNPSLSEQEIADLFSYIITYEIAFTRHQQINRIVKGIDALFQAKASHAAGEEEASLAEKLFKEMQQTRVYDVQAHPEYLNLEIALNCQLRLDQLNNLALLLSDPVALEASMGSGKTTVLLTMLAFLEADGEQLPMAILPEALLASQSSEMKERISTFGKRLEVMNFVRSDDFSWKSLDRILMRLKEIIRDKKALAMADPSIQSLFLTFIEKALGGDTRTSLQEIKVFREIWKLQKSKAAITIDEVDYILDVMKAHHFATGSEAPLLPETLSTIIDLYRFVASQKREHIGFSFLRDKLPFTPELFQTQMRPTIIQAIIDGKVVREPETTEFLSQAKDSERKWLQRYLTNDPACDADAFFHNRSMTIKNVMAVLKEELTTFLPLTAKKNVDEHYGVIPSDVTVSERQRLFAIPYHGSNKPAIIASDFAEKNDQVNFSVFGTPEETINYTIQMYLTHGITLDILNQELSQLKEQAMQDFRHRKYSPATQSFYRLAGNQKLTLFNLSETDRMQILAHVNQHPEMILELVHRHVLPELRIHPMQLISSGEIYGALFHKTNAFSGTLRNTRSLPNLFKRIIPSRTMVESLRLLQEKSSSEVAVIKNEGDPSQLVDSIYDRGFTGSFIDIGGLFRGIPNEKVVQEILRHTDRKGIVFYQENQRMVMLKDTQKIVPYEHCDLKKEEIIAYWDQSRSRGSDIPLGTMMAARASFSQHTTLTGLVQGIRRLRELHFGQRVDLLVSEKDSVIIRAALKELTGKDPQPLTLKDLVLYALVNENKHEKDHNYRSLHHKWKGCLLKRVMETVIDCSDPQDIVRLIQATRDLYVSTSSLNPYDQYGTIAKEMEGKKVVEQELQAFLQGSAMKAFAELPILTSRYKIQEIIDELRKMTQENLPFIPERLDNRQGRLGLEVHVEAEKQVEKQTEKQTEIQSEIELRGYNAKFNKPRPVIPWALDQLFVLETYQPISQSSARQMDAGQVTEQTKRCMNISEVLAADDTLCDFASVFDLEESVNFMPAYLRDSDREPPCTPLGGAYEATNPHIIIVQEGLSGKIRFILADQEEAKAIKKLLQTESASPWQGKRELKICLYQLDTGIEQQGSDRFNEDELNQNPQFQQLRTEALFRRGDQYYTEEDFPRLSSWIQRKGALLMERLFHTLSRKPKSPDSDIARLFRRI